MLVLRIRCVDDGRELLLERYGADEYSIKVIELKTFALQQRRQFYFNQNDKNSLDSPEDCFVLLHGHILADSDIVDLNALNPSDFFVFVPDKSQSERNPSSNSEIERTDADFETFQLLQSQLMDMGFSAQEAAQALQQSGNNLAEAVALLTEGKIQDVATNHQSIASKAPDVPQELLNELREVVAVDSLETVLRLQQLPSEMLHQVNENPVATLRFLLSEPDPAPSGTSMPAVNDTEAIVDVEKETKAIKETRDSSNAVVDRLVAMGFDRDLVKVMYESCGGDEHLTANGLLQTLES